MHSHALYMDDECTVDYDVCRCKYLYIYLIGCTFTKIYENVNV